LSAAAAYWCERGLLVAAAMTEWKEYQKLESDPTQSALVTKRMDLLDRADQWLTAKGLGSPPPRKRP
jgi:hypothetical protein